MALVIRGGEGSLGLKDVAKGLLELGLIFLLISQDISNLILPDEKGRVVIVALGVLDEEQGRAHRISFWVESLRIPHVQRIEKGLQVIVACRFCRLLISKMSSTPLVFIWGSLPVL